MVYINRREDNMKIQNPKSGLTIIEVIIAILVITMGIVGVLALASKSTASISVSKNKFIAANLVQEGIEVVRNIRDTNWLQRNDWDENLGVPTSSCPTFTNWELDYNTAALTDDYDGDFLNIDRIDIVTPIGEAGQPDEYDPYFYGYFSPPLSQYGEVSIFQRKVSLCYLNNYQIRVKVEVYFNDRGRSYTVSAQEEIFNWK